MFALQRHEAAAAAAATQILPRGATKKGEKQIERKKSISEKPKVKTSNMVGQKVRLGQVRCG